MNNEFNRVRLDGGVSNQLKRLQQTTGLTPNHLARIGLCYSLREPRPPAPDEYNTEGKVINRFTLLGDHDALYMALLRKRIEQDGYDPDEELYYHLLAHINRGVESLSGRVHDLTDLYDILPDEVQEGAVADG